MTSEQQPGPAGKSLTGSTFSPLTTAILRTLAYYDVHNYPLTTAEIWRWLYPAPGLPVAADQGMIESALSQPPLNGLVERNGQMVTLKGRLDLIQQRGQRLLENERKWKRARTVAKYLEVVPFIKLVAVVNTLAINNARPDSDIDLLIVTSPGHIWISRLMVTGIVSLLGYRRHKDKIANRVCLSFYLTSHALNLEPLKRSEPDHHFMFWASQAVPLLDNGTYEKFVQANQWITDRLPNAWHWSWKQQLVPTNSGYQSIKTVYEAFFTSPIGAWIEAYARQRQMNRFAKDTESKSREDNTDVVISEDVLKFHEADRRVEYNRAFAARLKSLGLEVEFEK